MRTLRFLGLLVVGLALGLAIGLFYARAVSPLAYSGTAPVSLRPDARDRYRLLVAAAFSADGDLGRARARLALLHDASPARALAVQAQQLVAQGGSLADARRLALLALALGKSPGGTALPPAGPAARLPPAAARFTRVETAALRFAGF